jgi:hypothetical protein
MRRNAGFSAGFVTSAIVFVSASSAFAAPPKIQKIDPNILRATRAGIMSASSRSRLSEKVPVLIELDHVATQNDFAKLSAAGVEIVTAGGIPIAYNRFVAARVDEKSANVIAQFSDLRRITLTAHAMRMPLDHSAQLLKLDDARGSQPATPAMDRLTGQGITIADEDSLVDVFEPALFRADAGYFDWIDVNKNGSFTPGVDAIDVNANGVVDDGEVAQMLQVQTVDAYEGPISGVRNDAFDPGLDWLYIDTNKNGQRDYGPSNGFTETTPAYGEPLFVPDDVNINGKIDVGERVIQLGSSKFKAVRVDVDYAPYKVNQIFTRGSNLVSTPTDITKGTLYGFSDSFHATGVSTILAGDVPLVGRRWVGIAPDADLIVSFDVASTGDGLPANGETWLLQQKPDVMLHELALWAGVPLDGSDELSALIDTSVTTDKVTQTCPTGDQGSALKHARSTIAASGEATLPFNVPATTLDGAGPLTYVEVSLNVVGGDLGTTTIVQPSGDSITLTANGSGTLASGALYYITEQTTSRGTRFWDVIFYTQGTTASLATGAWKAQIAAGTSPVVVDAYIEDDKSSWAVGAAWDKSVSSEAYLPGVPSVADHCIAVGASPNHVGDAADPEYDLTFYVEYNVPAGYEETQNQVRAYSPVGPRIDGVQKPDILAPDNPWVALAHTPESKSAYGSYDVFGGTSGASPHVTGVGALLAQANVRGDDARDAIRKSAFTDGTEGTLPNGSYGYGHLDAAKALGVTAVGTTPTVTLTANPISANVGDQVTLTATASGGDLLQVKFDDDYDGTWDTDYAAPAPRSVTWDHAGIRHFKVRARNSSGRVAEAVAEITFTPAGTSTSSTSSSSGCGCNVPSRAPSFAGLSAIGVAALALLRRKKRRITS